MSHDVHYQETNPLPFHVACDFVRPGGAVWRSVVESWTLALYAPVAVYRNRERSVPDEQSTEATGVYRHRADSMWLRA